MNKKVILMAVLGIIILSAGVYFGLSQRESPPIQTPSTPVPITVTGEIACLPKVGTGAQTLECAIGLKGNDGRYYGLKNLFELDPEYKFSRNGIAVEVSGTLVTEEMTGPDGNRYDIAGTIEVTSIREIGN